MEIVYTKRRWWFGPLAILLFLGCVASTAKVFVDVAKWRDAGRIARCVACDPHAKQQQRIDAIVILHRDTCASIRLLRAIEQEGGAVGDSARNVLTAIREEAAK